MGWWTIDKSNVIGDEPIDRMQLAVEQMVQACQGIGLHPLRSEAEDMLVRETVSPRLAALSDAWLDIFTRAWLTVRNQYMNAQGRPPTPEERQAIVAAAMDATKLR